MMKNIIVILAILFVGCFGFLLLNKHYALTTYDIPLFSVPKGHVRIDFVNKADEPIKIISLSNSPKKIENIKVGERRTVLFPNRGEATYQFTVEFESGKQLKQSERYIETGYFITEKIYPKEVK